MHSREPRASRRGRRRPARRRRRRHPDPDPARLPRPRNAPSSSFKLPKPGHYAVGHLFMPQDERLRAHCERVWTRIIREEGLEFLGWRSVPVDNSCLSEMVKATEPVHRQVFIGRPKAMNEQEEFERRLYLIRKVVSNALYYAYKGRDIGHYTVSLSSRTLVYKGMFLSYQVKAYYKDLSDPRAGLGDGAGAPALLDQHLPVVEARASLSHGRPQRRDQHAARQRQLDGGAAGVGVVAAVRQRHLQAVADLLRGPVGHRLLRQRARIPGDGRLQPGARRDDADPGGVGRQSADGCQAPRLLRVSRLPDGAVGRPGRHGLHRRPPDRRHARPQRLAAGPLSRHQGRPRDHVVGGRRAAGGGGEHRAEVAPAARQDAADRPGKGPHHLR